MGNIFGGGSESKPRKITQQELDFIEKQIELADFQLTELKRTSTIQTQFLEELRPLVQAQTAEAEQARVEQERLAPIREELLNIQLEDLRRGGEATPEQIRLIEESTDAALERGLIDIERFETQGLETLREELAPSLGLRPTDTPIQDRGGRLAAEALRQRGALGESLRGVGAQARLNVPLAQSQITQASTQAASTLQESIKQFQDQLRQQAFTNRLGLQSQVSSLGLGLGSVSPSHSLTSSFGILLIGEALLGMVLMENSPPAPQYAPLFEVGWALLIAVTYLVSMRLVYNFEKRLLQRATPETVRMRVGRKFYARLFITTLILIVASWWLTQLGDTLSTHEIEMIGRPLGATFVGACFLALATSLPEIATSVAAVRIGNLDLALGNIFGSNMFNIFVIPILKAVSLCTGQDRLLAGDAYRGSGNLIAGLLAVLLTAIALGALTYKSKRRMLRRFGLDSILIAIIYAGGMILLVGHGGN